MTLDDVEEDRAGILIEVCAALSGGYTKDAGAILSNRYPFEPMTNAGRHYSVRQTLAIFRRDGFTDRYSGARLVCGPALRVISKRLPTHFPFQANWRTDACHFAFWELTPTVDHMMPISRGGADDESNWVTTSMVRNSAKGNFTLADLGWILHPPCEAWDGLLNWFVEEAKTDATLLADSYLRQWFVAATRP